ncbi:MAG: PilZ domain-containing protein [Deltaproteobacteria bacterium]|nr:PilZ domain-containing protein [Deltaproteobacteria bacterium]
MKSDRRDSYRVTLRHGQVTVEVEAEGRRYEALDIAAGGAKLFVPPQDVQALRNAEVWVRAEGLPPFRANVEPVASRGNLFDDRIPVSVRFSRLGNDGLATLCELIARLYMMQSKSPQAREASEGRLTIIERKQIMRIIRQALSEQRGVLAYTELEKEAIELKFTALQEHGGQEVLRVEGDAQTVLRHGQKYVFAFAGKSALHVFSGVIERAADGGYRVTVPQEIEKTGFRGSRRVRPTDELLVSFVHPRQSERTLKKNVTDVSSGGLAFSFDPRKDLLFPGERLVLDLGDGQMWAEAMVRSLAPRSGDNGLSCGVEFVRFPQRQIADRWREFVFHQSYPSLRLGEQQSVQQAWEVLESSNYVGGETTAGMRDELRQNFHRAWNRFSKKSHFGTFFVAYHDEQPVGTVAANLLYPGTWLLHHFGIDERSRTQSKRFLFDVAHSIYLGMLQLLQQLENFEHFVIFADAGRSWNRMMYGHFLDQYSRGEDYVYDKCVVYKCTPCEELLANLPSISAQCDIELAREEQLTELADLLALTCTPVERRAMALDPGRLALRRFSEYCSQRDYLRDRRIFVAVKQGEAVGYIVAERGDEGANVFHLLNRCWLIRATDDDQIWAAARAPLLRRALEHYVEHGAPEALFLSMADDAETEAELAQFGLHRQASGMRYIGGRHLIPSWMNYVDELLGTLRGTAQS